MLAGSLCAVVHKTVFQSKFVKGFKLSTIDCQCVTIFSLIESSVQTIGLLHGWSASSVSAREMCGSLSV